MGILEGLVIVTIILVGVWVGYHAWQESLHDTGESHNIDAQIQSYKQFPEQLNIGLSEHQTTFKQ